VAELRTQQAALRLRTDGSAMRMLQAASGSQGERFALVMARTCEVSLRAGKMLHHLLVLFPGDLSRA